jgi:hypothetical protein
MKPCSISPSSFTSVFSARKYSPKLFSRQLMAFVVVSSFALLTSLSVNASIWMDSDDPYLKASIRALANGGVIKTPINTYPLMYKSIMADLRSSRNHDIAPHLQFALQYVEHALKFSELERSSGVKLKAASKTDDFQSFEERHLAKGELNLFTETISDRWAFKSSVHLTKNAANDKNLSFEGSYLATYLGNWVISLDQVSQWWGPGQDSAMTLSNNAVAFPAIRFTRHSSEPIDLPVLNWLGPVSTTTYFGQQEHSNELQNIRTWGLRINFKPFDSLEIGLTRTAQWGGRGRPTDFSTFINLLKGEDNTTLDGRISRDNEPGNQLGGADFHWRDSLFGQDVGVYGEIVGEDEAGGLPSHTMYQVGMETSFGSVNSLNQLFFEYVNTMANCNDNAAIGTCGYEHHVFREGYRRYGRSMGSTYDNDTTGFIIGLTQTRFGGISWYGKLKYLNINKDNSNNVSAIHPVSEFAQKRLQLEAGYRTPLMEGLLNIQVSLYRSKLTASNINDTDGSIKTSWEYRF